MKKPKIIAYVDENGEIHERDFKTGRVSETYNKKWMATSLENARRMSQMTIFCRTSRIFFYMVGQTKFNNKVPITQGDISNFYNAI